MRAREFTINVPITITINGDDEPIVNAAEPAALHQNPVMVTPQQQELELKKAELGKKSPVIDKLTADDNIGSEPQENEIIQLLRALKSR